jgi:hypothetical protein
LRARVAADQVGTFVGGSNIAMASGNSFTIPSSCSSLNIPAGAPVIALKSNARLRPPRN